MDNESPFESKVVAELIEALLHKAAAIKWNKSEPMPGVEAYETTCGSVAFLSLKAQSGPNVLYEGVMTRMQPDVCIMRLPPAVAEQVFKRITGSLN
jgi:hypothetical protein